MEFRMTGMRIEKRWILLKEIIESFWSKVQWGNIIMKDLKGTQNREYPAAFSEYINKFQELKAVFDNLPEGVVGILDVDLNIATANNAFSKMLKLPPNNIVGQNATKLFKEKVPDLIELLKETIQTRKGIRNYTMEIVNSSGEATSYLVSTAIIQ